MRRIPDCSAESSHRCILPFHLIDVIRIYGDFAATCIKTQVFMVHRHRHLVNQACIAYFCDFLLCPDNRTLKMCLVGLKNILKVGEAEKGDRVNLYAQIIKELDGFWKIENLKTSPDNGEMATKILRSYWKREDDK